MAPTFEFLLAAGGEMAALIQATNWSATPLGPPRDWPQILQSLTYLMLASSQPMFVVWGKHLTTIYNDAYAKILAEKHPALGEPFDQIWHEIWESDLEAIVTRAYAGEALHMDDYPLVMLRKGFPEEAHFSFSYTPVRDASGSVQGFFCPCLEITDQIIEQRRARLRAALTERLKSNGDTAELAFEAAALLARHLNAGQAAYAELDATGEFAEIERDWNDGSIPSVVGRHKLQDIGPAFLAALRGGRSVTVGDVRHDLRAAMAQHTFVSRGICAFMHIPYIRHGRLAAILTVHSSEPRYWHPTDIALAEEIAERVNIAIERARAEAEMRKSKAVLRKAEERCKIALESGGMGAWTWNVRARTVRSDEAFQALWGLSLQGQEQTHPVSMFTERMKPEAAAIIEAVMTKDIQAGEEFHDQVQVIAGPTAGRWVQWRGRAEQGKPWIINGVSFDITEQKRAEVRLRENEQRLRRVLDIETVGVVYFDLSGRVCDANDAFLTSIGYSRAELEAGEIRIHNLAPPEWRWRDENTISALISGGSDGPIEKQYVRKDGAIIWMLCASKKLDDRTVVEFAIDVTERKRVDAALLESEARLGEAARAAHFGIFDADLVSNNVFWSEEMHEIIGRSPDVPIALTIPDFVHPDDRPAVADMLEQVRHPEGDGQIMSEHRIVRPDGDVRWLQLKGRVDRDKGSLGVKPVRFRGMAIDVTDRKRQEEQVRLLLREVNHRSKNMLSLIQAIARRTVTTSPKEFLTRFDERIHSLAAAQDLLIKSEWKDVILSELLRLQLDHFSDLIGRRIMLSGPAAKLTTHATQALGMAFHELATNAAKYGALSNEAGCVEVTWRFDARRDNTEALIISWREKGGPHITEPAQQGFGTSVITSMLERSLEGSTVDLAYKPEGLDWQLTCHPRAVIDVAVPEPDCTSTSAPGRRVLVVEDEVILASYMVSMLSEAGFSVCGPASTVARALTLLENQDCDIAILDANLRNETSEVVAETLAAKNIPFVVVTGYSRAQLPKAMQAAPMFTKPLREAALLAELERLMDAKPSQS